MYLDSKPNLDGGFSSDMGRDPSKVVKIAILAQRGSKASLFLLLEVLGPMLEVGSSVGIMTTFKVAHSIARNQFIQ